MNSYTVRLLDHCRIVTGHVPLVDMAILLKGWAETGHDDPAQEWVVNADLAARMGATMVCGPREAIDALQESWGKKHVEARRSDGV